MKQLALIAAAGVLAGAGLTATPASAELTPWETFCLIHSDPGEDLDRCLKGLPSRGGNETFVAPKADSSDGQNATVKFRSR